MCVADFAHKLAGMRGTLQSFTRNFTIDKEESSDLVQDTILKALTYRDKYREDTNFNGWLFTIMRNTFINNYRKKKYAGTFYDYTKESYFLNTEDRHTFSSPEKKFEYEDIWKNVHEIEEGLLIPFKMYVTGYKYHEIAEKLDIPIGTVKNRIFQARKAIQIKLNDPR